LLHVVANLPIILTSPVHIISFQQDIKPIAQDISHCGPPELGLGSLPTAWPTTRPFYSTLMITTSTISLYTLSLISLSEQ